MEISFIIPAYNLEYYIEECIRSITRQNYYSYEIIIIDDGSTDKTPQICDKLAYDNSNISVIHQNNSGVSVARNRGLQEAKGKYICFVDGDDWLENDFCNTVTSYFNEDIEIYFFGYYIARNEKRNKICNFCQDNTMFEKKDFKWFQRCMLNRYLNVSNAALGQPWGKIYKKSFLEKNKLLFKEGIPLSEDLLFNLYAFDVAEQGIYINKSLYNYRITNNATTKKYCENAVVLYLNQITLVKRFLDDNNRYSDLKEEYYIRNIINYMYCIILDLCHKNNCNSYLYRKNKFLLIQDIDIFKESIMKAQKNQFPFKQRIIYYCIRKRYFWILNCLCKFYR